MSAADAALPQPLAEEILGQYADVLRVGRLALNGRTIVWDSSASSSQQLQSLCHEFVAALRQIPALSTWGDEALGRVVYWFCKVVSINYVLAEVLDLLRRRLGAQCAIRTTGEKGLPLVDYSAEVRPDCSMRIRLSFGGRGNILSYNPGTGKKQIRGTLSSLEAEFPLPPNAGFAPTYHLDMALKGSRTSQLVERVARTCAVAQAGPRQKVSLDAPLRAKDLDIYPGGISALSTMSTRTSDSVGSTPSEFEEDDALFSIPLSFTAHSVKWGPSLANTAGRNPNVIRL